MKINIWGCRGSIPAPSGKTPQGKERITHEFGGETTCIEVIADEGTRHILDAGSGIRELGNHYLTTGQPLDANLYITHTHWDHIQGLPFFTPAYIPGNKISIFGDAKVQGCNPALGVKQDLESAIRNHSDQSAYVSGVFSVNGKGIKEVLQDQMAFRNFPAPLDIMKGINGFYDFMPGVVIYESDNFIVDTLAVNHPGGCISYRFTEIKPDNSRRVFVHSTDFEPDENGYDDTLAEFWQGADLIYADAQYEPRDAPGEFRKLNPFMPTWGHSDYKSDLMMASVAQAKEILLGHNEPKLNDDYHRGLEVRAQIEAERQASSRQLTNPVLVQIARQGMSRYL